MRQNPHVRICGGPGSATTLVYPTDERCACEAPLSEQDLGHPWFCSSRRRIFKALLLGSSSRNAKERGTL